MAGKDVADVVEQLTSRRILRVDSARYWRGGPLVAHDDGMWQMDPEHPHVRSMREAVRKRLETERRHRATSPHPAVIAASRRHHEEERAAHAAELARLRRVLVHAFPARKPQAVVVVDIATRDIAFHTFDGFDHLREQLAQYEFLVALDVRGLLRGLEFDPADRRLAELGPSQKSMRLNKQGRTLRITTEMLIQGSCGISRPLGDEAKLRQYLRDGQTTRLRRRLESDAKSLFALYQYGRVHRAVRLRWGFLDEMLPAPWVHSDERALFGLMRQAQEDGEPLEVVVGSAPGWSDPWARVRRAWVGSGSSPYRSELFDEDGVWVDSRDVQLARRVEG